MPAELRNTRTGQMRVATPETTAFDLAGYVQRSGGLNHVATVLAHVQEWSLTAPWVGREQVEAERRARHPRAIRSLRLSRAGRRCA
jgi:hypothetical protein